MTTTYTPVTVPLRNARVTHDCCTHCGATREAHFSDGRCYTVADMVARLQRYAATGVWPRSDDVRTEDIV